MNKQYILVLVVIASLLVGCTMPTQREGINVSALNNTLNDQQAKLSGLGTNISSLNAEIEQLRDKVRRQEETITQMQRENAALTERIHNLSQQLNITRGELAEAQVLNNAIGTEEIKDGSVGRDDINSEEVQLRINGSCGEGYYLSAVKENGSVVCKKIPQPETPSLNEVLEVDSSANGHSIREISSLDADEVCINGSCKQSWPRYRLTQRSAYFYAEFGDNKIFIMRRNNAEDICVVSSIKIKKENGYCKIIPEEGKQSVRVYVGSAECDVVCFGLEAQ